MVKRVLNLIVPIMALVSVTSCNKGNIEVSNKAVVNIAFAPINSTSVASPGLQPATKASGTNHGNSTFDAEVQTLQIFAFNSNGSLDAYTSQSGSPIALKSGNTPVSFNITVSKGSKTIYAIANSHDLAQFASIKTLSELEAKVSSLKSENARNFFMLGKATQNITSDITVNIELNRLVSRVELLSLQTAFTGGYAGLPLTDVKVYLINVNPNTSISTGLGSGTKLNQNALVPADTVGCAMSSMLGTSLPNITGTAYTTPNYFYCYANSDASAKTMLVIEGKLNSQLYYYPIVITDAPGATYMLSRNMTYEISNMIITRPGSDRPDIEVEKGAVSLTLTVKDWTKKSYATITI
ncbi:MAG: fimbrial protein [Bacteroidales bacterium]|nr:fimbrial protein [Bacteroidales bacterium]MDD4670928.1 fimbrial protein [Bacteroidales bacterium]